MKSLLESVAEVNDLIIQGKGLEAFEKYYGDNVSMQENDLPPTVGKAENRAREVEFYSNVLEFRIAKPLKVAIGEGVSMVEWKYDYTHKAWGEREYLQVAVQLWEDGKIVKEKFYYPC